MMWRPSTQCGDDMGMMGMTWGQHGDNMGTMGTTGTKWGGDHRDHSHGDHMGTFWGYGHYVEMTGMMWDDVGTMGTMWGQ